MMLKTPRIELRETRCGDADCPDEPGRRQFMQGCFALSVALLGLSAVDAAALPVAMMDGAQNGTERRYPIPPSDGVNVDRSAQVILVRYQGHMYAFALSCPHQNNAVKWLPKDQRFQCTKHDSEYTPGGVYTTGHSTRNMDRYIIRRDGDAIVLDLRRWVQSDKDPAGWAAATLTL